VAQNNLITEHFLYLCEKYTIKLNENVFAGMFFCMEYLVSLLSFPSAIDAYLKQKGNMGEK